MAEMVYDVDPVVPKIRHGMLQPNSSTYRGLRGMSSFRAMPASFTEVAAAGGGIVGVGTTILGGALGAAIGLRGRSPGFGLLFAVIIGWALGGVSPGFARGFAAGLGGVSGVYLLRGRR